MNTKIYNFGMAAEDVAAMKHREEIEELDTRIAAVENELKLLGEMYNTECAEHHKTRLQLEELGRHTQFLIDQNNALQAIIEEQRKVGY